MCDHYAHAKKLKNLIPFSKGVEGKVVSPFIIKKIQKYENLGLTTMWEAPSISGRISLNYEVPEIFPTFTSLKDCLIIRLHDQKKDNEKPE